MCLVLALVVEIIDSIAIGKHNAVEPPLAAQDVHQQAVAGATGDALVAVVGTHHLAHIALLHQRLEGGQIGFPQIAHGDGGIVGVAERLGPAMHGIVLGTGVGLVILVIVALHAQNGLYAQDGIQVGVFTTGLLTTSPTRVAEDVDIGTPEGQLGVAGIVDDTHRNIEDIMV